MKKSVWLTYDLGVQGDYKSLYAWLDDHNAIECGDSVSFFQYEYNDAKSFKEQIREDLKNKVKFESGNRIYIILSEIVEGEKKIKGSFLIGKRKASPWEGYGEKTDNTEEIGDE
ncbi:hypothetical protein EZS27_006903 [termite gut metagenome]|uniref:Uncharacterized protein n=1 Tax=termite gut metagenome TaxID=433724 RepID=A0A5J4SJY9_9ZZZZ